MPFLNKKTFNVALVLLAGILWGTIGIFTTPLNQMGFDSITIVGIRSLFTAVMLGVLLLIKDPKLFIIKLKDLWRFLGMGVLSFALFNICYMQSMKLNNSLGTACILMYTSPIFIVIFSRFLFKEKITPLKIFCLILSVVGCAFVSGGGNVTALGFIFGIGSGLGYGLYSIFSVYALKKYSFFTAIFYAFVFSSISLLPFSNVGKVITLATTNYTVVLLFLGLAFFITVLPYILYTCALRVVPTSEAGVICCIEPLIASVVGIMFFNQSMSLISVIGTAMILCAVICLSRQK